MPEVPPSSVPSVSKGVPDGDHPPLAASPSPDGSGRLWKWLAAFVALFAVVIAIGVMKTARNDDGSASRPSDDGGAATAAPADRAVPRNATPGDFTTPLSDTHVVAGVYRAMPDDVRGGKRDTAIEFEIVGSGRATKIRYVAGFGMQETTCKDGSKPTSGRRTFLDDEPSSNAVRQDGRTVETEFEGFFLEVTAAGQGGVAGEFAFSFDDLRCGGLIRFAAARDDRGERLFYDRVMLAAG